MQECRGVRRATTSFRVRSCMTAFLQCWILVFTTVGVESNELIDRVLAVAAGDVIMLSDVRAARRLALVDAGSASDPDRAALSRLIDRALMLDEVNRYAPPEPETGAIDRAVAAVRARFDSDAAFASALHELGLEERQLRETVRQDLRIREYLDRRFAGDSREQIQSAVDEWLVGLRRRADVVDLYETQPR